MLAEPSHVLCDIISMWLCHSVAVQRMAEHEEELGSSAVASTSHAEAVTILRGKTSTLTHVAPCHVQHWKQ